ncbi:hypothetical protein CRM22_005735 [Opisthorchis felineus]|uniref:RBD domain-containing protein n=1 Tax=Opisthorchis felineus TaxID=147828 RepID=A0A4S2LPR8_OPIFE|nr:hypothetical protein CRM22_005735 [Opisthorchis felineus]TGZ65732.1 hypothetical protein CRM22_005735 [Opisthorchis felineus]
MKFFERFKHLSKKHTANTTASPVNDKSTSSVIKCPTSMHRLGPDEHTSVNVELYHTGEIMRIYGFSSSSTCVDFTVNLCQLLKLKPSHYCLMVCEGHNDSSLSCWQRVPPSSQLSMWLETSYVKKGGFVRLVHKSYMSNLLKPSMVLWRPHDTQKIVDPVSGRKLLEQMGARILVYLPGERKIVVRARPNEQIAETVLEVCNQRNLSPSEYFLQNPRTGASLDPSLTFTEQKVTEFELKPCTPGASNLKSLNAVHLQSIDQANQEAKLPQPGPNILPISHKRLRSPAESRIYANIQRPHTMCIGYCNQLSEPVSEYATIDRPMSTISSKSRKKRMAPPPPAAPPPPPQVSNRTPLSEVPRRQQHQQKEPRTRSALTLGSPDIGTLSSTESARAKYRRRSASMKDSPYVSRSVYYSAKPQRNRSEQSACLRSPNTSWYSESFLPHSARSFEPKSEENPPTPAVSAASLPLSVTTRLGHPPEAGSMEPVAVRELVPESLPEADVVGDSTDHISPDKDEPRQIQNNVSKKSEVCEEAHPSETKVVPPVVVDLPPSSNDTGKPVCGRSNSIPPALMQQLQEKISGLPSAPEQSGIRDSTISQPAEPKEKPSIAPRPSMDVLLQHTKYRQILASAPYVMRPSSASGDSQVSTDTAIKLKGMTPSDITYGQAATA